MKKGLMSRLLGFILIALLGVAARTQAAPLLYGADGSGGNPSNLYIIDAATGAIVETVGPIGFAVTGLAVDPITGALYGATGGAGSDPGMLLTIDPTTGAGTIIGDFGTGGSPIADIAFDPGGTLYGWQQLGSDLYRINVTTGAAELVGDSGLFTSNSGLAIDAAGVAYFGGFDGNLIPGQFGLAQIDLATGAAVDVIPYSPPLPVGLGLTFDDAGVLYGIHKVDNLEVPRELVRIDPATGAITIIGDTVDRLDAIAFIPERQAPEPGVIALSLVAAAAGLRKCRRRTSRT